MGTGSDKLGACLDIPWKEIPRGERGVARAWVERGLPVRLDPGEAYAGRCGAACAPGAKHPHCRRAAGWGTDHSGWGRCRHHEGVEDGLPPWYGVADGELRSEVTGGHVPGGEGVGSPTHRATGLAKGSVREIMSRYMDEEELAIFDMAIQEPKDLLAVVMGVRSAALMRIARYVQVQKAQNRGVVTQDLLGAESFADRTAQTIARLAEARKAYLELEAGEKSSEQIRGMLSHLSEDDFARIKADPQAMAHLIAAGGV